MHALSGPARGADERHAPGASGRLSVLLLICTAESSPRQIRGCAAHSAPSGENIVGLANAPASSIRATRRSMPGLCGAIPTALAAPQRRTRASLCNGPIFVARQLLPRPSHPVTRRIPVVRRGIAFLNTLRCHPAMFCDPVVGFATRSIAPDAMACAVRPSYANGPMSISLNRCELGPRHPNNMPQPLLTAR
jgi:hypothetical protein